MDSRELRLGNLYDQFGNIHEATWVTIKDLSTAPKNQLWCKPIPLTEEWLVRMGFERGNNPRNIEKFPMQLLDSPNGFEYFYGYGFGGKFRKIKYVHQLQNLYWCLCGEELTIKSN